MNVDTYLRRIAYTGSREPSSETLSAIHHQHLLNVPFENLDISLGRPLSLSLPELYQKIVIQRRGGFCYELNGMFAWLLEQLGFSLQRLGARVFGGGGLGPELDHMLLLVDVGEELIADVGFGDSFREPLRVSPDVQTQAGVSYRLREQSTQWTLQQRKTELDWSDQYLFSRRPHELEDFVPMCHFQQTSADSIFTQKTVCSMASRDGRVTISNDRLIVSEAGERSERRIQTSDELLALLHSRFGISLGLTRDESLQQLLRQG